MRPRRKGKLQPLRDLVPKAYPKSDQADFLSLCAAWNRSVSPRILKNARPARFVRGKLIIHTNSSTWAQELDYMRETFLRDLRKGAPKSGISNIHFRVGRLPEIYVREAPARLGAVPTADIPEDVARELARISDDEVRNTIARAVSTTLGRAERRSRRE